MILMGTYVLLVQFITTNSKQIWYFCLNVIHPCIIIQMSWFCLSICPPIYYNRQVLYLCINVIHICTILSNVFVLFVHLSSNLLKQTGLIYQDKCHSSLFCSTNVLALFVHLSSLCFKHFYFFTPKFRIFNCCLNGPIMFYQPNLLKQTCPVLLDNCHSSLRHSFKCGCAACPLVLHVFLIFFFYCTKILNFL